MRFCFYIDELIDEEMARVACQPTTTTSIIDIGFFPFEVKCFSKGMQKCSKYYIFLFFSKSRPSSSTSFLHQHLIGLARLSLPLFWLLIQSPLVGGSRHYPVVNSSSPTIFPLFLFPGFNLALSTTFTVPTTGTHNSSIKYTYSYLTII